MAREHEGDLPARIRALATPVVAEHDVELVDVEIRGQRGSRVVRLIADAEKGIDIDQIAVISRAVGAVLDSEDVVAGRYTLEVTSPGLDRPLRSPWQFHRNVGRDVRVVRTREAIERGEKGEVTGTLVAADDDGLRLEVDGEPLTVPLTDVDHGKVVLPW